MVTSYYVNALQNHGFSDFIELLIAVTKVVTTNIIVDSMNVFPDDVETVLSEAVLDEPGSGVAVDSLDL